ncbi:hypothetical protein CHU92_00890 [Flavobacterium cyanobacteriorum]|uniref:Uncharacterized protein n=2 Tax=Flavobacterium cyanobacteriorum TaxID=2022802 RepID=A0A256A2L3_9FLAO|nr:hypothetical protein CHU92_00890 [Flavobacterium cyanobacteriorum]
MLAQNRLITGAEAVKLLENPEVTSVTELFEGEYLFDMYAKRDIGEIIIMSESVEKVIADEYIMAQDCGFVIVKTLVMTPGEIKAMKEDMLHSYYSGIGITEMMTLYGSGKFPGAESMYIAVDNPLYAVFLKKNKPGQPFFVDYPESGEFNFMVAHKYAEKKRIIKVLQAGYKGQ